MSPARSIRGRLVLGAAAVLVAFLALAGYAVQRAHEDSVRSEQFARLQGVVYLLLAGAELDAAGNLVMPPSFPEPRLALPGSGLYAQVSNLNRKQQWRSPSTAGAAPPFQTGDGIGKWRLGTVRGGGASYLAATYAVRWTANGLESPLVLSVVEDKASVDRESATFRRTLWSWLGGAALVLLVSQTLLLEWALAPLARVAREVRRMEDAQQDRIEGRYPVEIEALTHNINALVAHERSRQARHREALSFLAHSLKTPLAVLRAAADEPEGLRATVREQVSRMDDIVQHQLARAAAGAAALFQAPLPIAPLVERVRASLQKVYSGKQLAFAVDCPAGLAWRIDEGNAFELLGNLMDNAAKWARREVRVRAWTERGRLHLRVEDDGPGFPQTVDVLKLHVRGDERVPGHGVGLAVVAEVVQAHAGELKLSRSALGGAQVDVVLAG